MKTITISGKTHQISAPLERAIMQVHRFGPQAISDFEEGRGRYRRNPVASARYLERETVGALKINETCLDADLKNIPAAVMKARPRVTKWVMPADKRRFNLVVKKLEAA